MVKYGQEICVADQNKTFDNFGDINLIGLWTLYVKEVRRFLKVPAQTTVAPVITTLIFLSIFTLALGSARREIFDVPFLVFLAPGLIMMAMVQNSYANTSSSMIISKVQGNLIDLLMAPLGPGEIVTGFVLGGVTRGLIVGVAVLIAVMLFVDISPVYPFLAFVFSVLACTLLATLGLLTGIWAEKFDQTAALTNFVITPLSFLSGTFYSVRDLPETVQFIAYINPFFYMIDGLRFAFIGQSDGNVVTGLVILLVMNVVSFWFAYYLLKTGYRTRA